MEQLLHFSHDHWLSLVQLQQYHNKGKENSDNSEDEKEDDNFVVENHDVGKCKMCEEEIYSFHLCYYSCKECDYSLHKFCAQLPLTQQNHPLHPGHDLILSQLNLSDENYLNFTINLECMCYICNVSRNNFYNYYCFICKWDMDIICATMSEQNMNHPSHPHKLQRYFSPMISICSACGEKHNGTFYHCTTCSWYKIHLDCALLPSKLLIQETTNGDFNHSHFLTLVYSFPYSEIRAKFFPSCRVCGDYFSPRTWHYECNKCRYYAHVTCATSRRDAFMYSILLPAGLGKTYRNFKDSDHPNLVRYPFPDECMNLLKHHFFNKDGISSKWKFDDEEMFKRTGHQHPLILFDSFLDTSVSLYGPMKKIEILCDGCVRPITDVPFYKCSQHKCDFVLHEWCARLPSEIRDYHDHPDHTLVLFPKAPTVILGLFVCDICGLYCNGFAYGCKQCEYYVDINCGFIPDVITHDAHPNHLLHRFKAESTANYSTKRCKACRCVIEGFWVFRCSTCDLYLHLVCALLLPRTIRHRFDKHPLILRYHPVENQFNEYFCEICEDELDPEGWFYHCSTCEWSIHTACAPLKLQCELAFTSLMEDVPIFWYLNFKFGGTYEITRLHQHPFTLLQGINEDGQCIVCDKQLQCYVIFKCFRCKFVCHQQCLDDFIMLN